MSTSRSQKRKSPKTPTVAAKKTSGKKPAKKTGDKKAASAKTTEAAFKPDEYEHKTGQYADAGTELSRGAETWNTVIDSVESGKCKTPAAVVSRFTKIERTAVRRIGRMVNMGYWSVGTQTGNKKDATDREKNAKLGAKIVAELPGTTIKIVKNFPRRSVKR